MRGESTAVHRVIPLTLTLVQRGRGESFMDTFRQAVWIYPGYVDRL